MEFDRVLSEQEADAIDESLKDANRKLQARARRRHYAEEPCFRVPGPLIDIKYVPRTAKHSSFGWGANYFSW